LDSINEMETREVGTEKGYTLEENKERLELLYERSTRHVPPRSGTNARRSWPSRTVSPSCRKR